MGSPNVQFQYSFYIHVIYVLILQIDLYGIAGTMHCVYFSQYMKVFKESDGRWFIRQSFSRYSKRHLWEQFFYTLLNAESCEKLPDLPELRRLVEAEILSNKHFSDLTHVQNILGGKWKKHVNWTLVTDYTPKHLRGLNCGHFGFR